MEPFIKRKRYRKSVPKDGTVVVTAPQASLALARKVNRLSKIVKGIQPELKFLSLTGSAANVTDTTGLAVPLVFLTAGTDYNNRISDRVRVKRVQFTVRISTAAASLGATPTSEEFTRFYLIQDLQQVSDTSPTVNDVLFSGSTPQFPVLNMSTAQGRYKMLWHSPLMVHSRLATSSVAGAVTTPLSPTQSPVVSCDRSMDLLVTFNGTANTDIQKNGLYLLVSTNLAADTLDIDYNWRVSYLDD